MLVHVLITGSGDRFRAHALEFDLMTVGSTVGEALDHLYDQIEIYLQDCIEQGVSSWEGALRKAPQEYYDKFEAAFKRPDSQVTMATISIPLPFDFNRDQAAVALVG